MHKAIRTEIRTPNPLDLRPGFHAHVDGASQNRGAAVADPELCSRTSFIASRTGGMPSGPHGCGLRQLSRRQPVATVTPQEHSYRPRAVEFRLICFAER